MNMSEKQTQNMSEEKQESQKTVVAFIVGLLIGGLLVWVFSGAPAESPTENQDEDTKAEVLDKDTNASSEDINDVSDVKTDEVAELPTLEVGDGSVRVADQASGFEVKLDGAVFPTEEGWIGVRGYNDGQLTSILGVMRYSQEQGLVPNSIELQAPTQAGRDYAIVFFTENGDREFSLADDVQIDKVFATFTAK
ncbi:hypothetical protein KC723_02885 [Candidatus Kaiserbacteria bacterium]|nr:hypothetical protein [Candidatus Kaiserbacteria bacterium]